MSLFDDCIKKIDEYIEFTSNRSVPPKGPTSFQMLADAINAATGSSIFTKSMMQNYINHRKQGKLQLILKSFNKSLDYERRIQEQLAQMEAIKFTHQVVSTVVVFNSDLPTSPECSYVNVTPGAIVSTINQPTPTMPPVTPYIAFQWTGPIPWNFGFLRNCKEKLVYTLTDNFVHKFYRNRKYNNVVYFECSGCKLRAKMDNDLFYVNGSHSNNCMPYPLDKFKLEQCVRYAKNLVYQGYSLCCAYDEGRKMAMKSNCDLKRFPKYRNIYLSLKRFENKRLKEIENQAPSSEKSV